MSDDDNELSADMKSYFDSKGEKPLPGSKEPEAAKEDDGQSASSEKRDEPEQAASAEAKDEGSNDAEKADAPDDASDEPRQPGDKNRTVSHSAYLREQMRRKEAETRATRLQDEQARYMEEVRKRDELINQRLAMMTQQPAKETPAAPPAPAVPDPEQDIFGAAKFALDKLAQMEQREAEAQRQAQMYHADQQRQAEEKQRRAHYEHSLLAKYNEIGQARAADDPEFVPAYRFAQERRATQLMRDEGMNKAQAAAQVRREEFALVEASMRAGRDPTERIKLYAKDMGFTYKPEAKEAQPAQRLDALAKAQDAHKTLTGSGSPGSARSAVTAKDIASMNDEDFAAFSAKYGDKGFKAAMTR